MSEDSTAPIHQNWWGSASDLAQTTANSGFGAALWTWQDGVHERRAEASPDVHTISVCLDPLDTEFALDGRRVFNGVFEPGQLAVIPAQRRPWAVQRGTARKLHLYLPSDLLAAAAADGEDGSPSPPSLQAGVIRDPAVTRLCGRIVTELRTQRTGSRMLLDAIGMELAAHVSRHWVPRTPSRAKRRRRTSAAMVARARDYLQAHLADDLTLARVAAQVGQTPAQFCRSFSEATGTPPHRFLIDLRIERACAMLADPNLSIADVASAVGYDDPGYFARLFKSRIGTTPLAFRAEQIDRA